jgi:hypothetical protein
VVVVVVVGNRKPTLPSAWNAGTEPLIKMLAVNVYIQATDGVPCVIDALVGFCTKTTPEISPAREKVTA